MKEGMKCRILYARMRLKKLKKERKINNHPPSHFILDYSKLPEQLPAICFEWARSQCAVVGYTGNHQNYEAGNNKCAKTASRKESQVILTEPVPEF